MGAAGALAAGCGGVNAATAASPATTTGATTTTTPTATYPTLLAAMTGVNHHPVLGISPITVKLDAPPATNTPRPTITPHVAGTWTTSGDAEIFTPASTLVPCTTYRLTVPAATFSTGQTPLTHAHHATLKVVCPDGLALQEALARLAYLPFKMVTRYGMINVGGKMTRALAARHAFIPPHGRLVPTVHAVPHFVQGDGNDPTTVGALEVFQENHGIDPTGVATAQTWRVLLADETVDRRDPHDYTWVSVTEGDPETLEVHVGHKVALSTPANTGIPAAPTALGTFPIYARYVSTTMSGTNPDGTPYDDPGVPWVNYFNGGDAVHGFPRASYGFAQSLGCVELPISTAQSVYGMLQIGDIVQVE
ncbi:MAG TPA: L,D-transpeptidase family protein [Solirubrobacteraceae bacterium]|nr:L,D-transpeptidase family protein [Solirubrobacteraceae bacterium]